MIRQHALAGTRGITGNGSTARIFSSYLSFFVVIEVHAKLHVDIIFVILYIFKNSQKQLLLADDTAM